MKYYYTDPLAAAWMAKHFKMAFDIFVQPSGVRVEKEKTNAKYIAMLGDNYRCYVCEDSLHLLQPQIGDIGQLGGEPYTFAKDFGWQLSDCHMDLMPDFIKYIQIIQRNGIPFMWPEVAA